MAIKQSLTPEEMIRAAYGHFCLGLEQDSIAKLFCVNVGRVSEAISAIELACSDPKRMRERMELKKPGDA